MIFVKALIIFFLCILGTFLIHKFKASLINSSLNYNLMEKELNQIDSIRGSKKWIIFLIIIVLLHLLNFIFCSKFIYVNIINLIKITKINGYTFQIKIYWISLFITFIGCLLTIALLYFEMLAIKIYKEYQSILRNYDNTKVNIEV